MLDYGTTQCKVAYEIRPVNANPNPERQHCVCLSPRRTQVPQTVAFIRENDEFTFHWGYELEDLFGDNNAYGKENTFIFESLKTGFYDSQLQTDDMIMIKEELRRLEAASIGAYNLSFEDLMTMHLRCIREQAVSVVDATESRLRTPWANQIRSLRQRWTFGVPEIMTLSSNQQFAAIIRDAGFPPDISLVTETEAAAAHLVQKCNLMASVLHDDLQVRFILCPKNTSLTPYSQGLSSLSAMQVGLPQTSLRVESATSSITATTSSWSQSRSWAEQPARNA